jgi:hypothetical protein
MPPRSVAGDSDDLDATAKSAVLGDTLSSQHQPPPSRRRIISHEYAEAMANRLAKFNSRPEYLQTPGPYTIRYNPNNRKIPFVFPSMERFPPPPPVPSDSLDCNRAQCEARSRDVVFTKEERFLLPPSATKDVPVYDVESGVRLCEERAYSTLLPPHGDSTQRPSRRAEPAVLDLPPPTPTPQGFNTSMIVGGRISKSGVRDVNDFLVRRSASPGPVYSPSYSAVESASFAARFSTQSRMPIGDSGAEDQRSITTSSGRVASSTSPHRCKRLGEYPDCDNGVRNFSVLSTWENAPVAAIGKPVTPYTNPNKQQAPPPPEDTTAPVRRSQLSARPTSAARALRGSVVIQNSHGEANSQDEESGESRDEGGACGSPDEDRLYVWPVAGDGGATANKCPSRQRSRPTSAPLWLHRTSSASTMISRTQSIEKKDARANVAGHSPRRVAAALESPFHASRVESPAPVHVTIVALTPSPSPAHCSDPRPVASQKSTGGKGGTKQRWIRDASAFAAAVVSRRPQSATCPHPWMAPNDYMQADVAAKVTNDVVALCGNPRRVKFGADGGIVGGQRTMQPSHPPKRQVAGGWGWASSWQRGTKSASTS